MRRWWGTGLSADAYHITGPPGQRRGCRPCHRGLLEVSQIDPADVDYINAHGTSAPSNDISKTSKPH